VNALDGFQNSLSFITGSENLWYLEIFLVVSATLISAYALHKVMLALIKKAAATQNLWDDAFLEALLRPAKWVVWLVGLSYAAELASQQSSSSLLLLLGPLRKLTFIGLVSWFLVRFIAKAERNLVDPKYAHKPLDITTVVAIGKLLRVSIVITSSLIVLQTLGYSVSGVLAFGGIGGLAVGFAAKDLLANFFGGLMVYLDRPFKVGDWIRSPDKSIEGTVEDIGWRLTRIRTFDKRPLYVPNAIFTQIAVENPSRMSNRRIKETIGIRYDDADKIAVIVSDVEAMLKTHSAIDQRQTLMVNFNTFAASSLDFFIYTFTKTTNWAEYHKIKQDVLLKVLAVIESHGAECAFPTSTVHLNYNGDNELEGLL
jgi:MscS family membrane protein